MAAALSTRSAPATVSTPLTSDVVDDVMADFLEGVSLDTILRDCTALERKGILSLAAKIDLLRYASPALSTVVLVDSAVHLNGEREQQLFELPALAGRGGDGRLSPLRGAVASGEGATTREAEAALSTPAQPVRAHAKRKGAELDDASPQPDPTPATRPGRATGKAAASPDDAVTGERATRQGSGVKRGKVPIPMTLPSAP
jgi:hypothetical protein